MKITKASGLPHSRRRRDICRAAGITIGVQDATGSTLTFTDIVHMGATVPTSLLLCVLDARNIIEHRIGTFHAPIQDAASYHLNPLELGVTIDRGLSGQAVST